MLWHARQKHDKYNVNLPVTFCLADAQRMLSTCTTDVEMPEEAFSKAQQPRCTYQDKLQTFSPAQFDTVIDTFGLCSHADPIAALKVGVCTTSKVPSSYCLLCASLTALALQPWIAFNSLVLMAQNGILHHTMAFA